MLLPTTLSSSSSSLIFLQQHPTRRNTSRLCCWRRLLALLEFYQKWILAYTTVTLVWQISTSVPNLTKTSFTTDIWPIIQIKDGGRRHLEFLKTCNFRLQWPLYGEYVWANQIGCKSVDAIDLTPKSMQFPWKHALWGIAR